MSTEYWSRRTKQELTATAVPRKESTLDTLRTFLPRPRPLEPPKSLQVSVLSAFSGLALLHCPQAQHQCCWNSLAQHVVSLNLGMLGSKREEGARGAGQVGLQEGALHGELVVKRALDGPAGTALLR